MKYFYIVLLSISVISCTVEKKNETPLFNGLTFNLYDGEAIEEINSRTGERYSCFFNDGIIQIPLYKYIKHSNYDIFIGIPYNTSIEALVKSKIAKQDSTDAYFKSDSVSFYKKYAKDGLYITEYASKIEDLSLIYIAAMSESRELSDSLFTETKLSERINTNKK